MQKLFLFLRVLQVPTSSVGLALIGSTPSQPGQSPAVRHHITSLSYHLVSLAAQRRLRGCPPHLNKVSAGRRIQFL
ncbi:MAG: hypothetical protein NO515_04370, partial [Candidatus Methanomethylicia archaeon]|nr:hypothetical protein [Candidatus Methanomethylicia archaeon]